MRKLRTSLGFTTVEIVISLVWLSMIIGTSAILLGIFSNLNKDTTMKYKGETYYEIPASDVLMQSIILNSKVLDLVSGSSQKMVLDIGVNDNIIGKVLENSRKIDSTKNFKKYYPDYVASAPEETLSVVFLINEWVIGVLEILKYKENMFLCDVNLKTLECNYRYNLCSKTDVFNLDCTSKKSNHDSSKLLKKKLITLSIPHPMDDGKGKHKFEHTFFTRK